MQQLEQQAQQRMLEKEMEMAEMQKKCSLKPSTREDRHTQLIEQSREALTSMTKEKLQMQMQIDQLEQERKRQEAQSAQVSAMMQHQHETRQAEEAERHQMVI